MICVAAIAGAFGVKGEVRLKPFTEDPLTCATFGPLLDVDGKVVLTPCRPRVMKGALIISAEEVKTREQAQAMKSTKLYVPANLLPVPDEDDFYYSDLIGLDVKSVSGQRIGKVAAVHEFGAGDMLEIKPKHGASFYHPFTKRDVPKVDVAKGRVIIIPLPEAE